MAHNPRYVPQVMVSSTFTDLEHHRAAAIDAIHKHKLHANVMEHDGATPAGDVIDSSLGMVRDSAAFICLISRKYGQTPECPQRNPETLSLTELEFDEAQRLGRPTLLFIMGESHPVTEADVELDPEKRKKLIAFRERAKRATAASPVHRVFADFNSYDQFKNELAGSLFNLHAGLRAGDGPNPSAPPAGAADADAVPKPPAFYAQPPYIGSHDFVGREAELQMLSDWAAKRDQTNLLLFEAIGGSGKSMLTWEWTTKHAEAVRPPGPDSWAGRFWYSFYERGAVMADFCRRSLAYMTGQPLESFANKKTTALEGDLLAQLRAKPWLIVLDGLERVLVAYHRIDATELRDEEANTPTDKIAARDPCGAIRDEDDALLRALAGAGPSKILVSSRLTPRALVNPTGQAITGVKRIALSGLRPPDAEKLLRSCKVEGDSTAIQHYLATNCDNHPLVIGILGGLIRNYLPARNDFDAWAAADDGGAKLELAELDLVQRRNHILRAAIDALGPASRELLSTLALLSGSVDYEVLNALNPHIKNGTSTSRAKPDASKELTATVIDLERRGLLQYDEWSRRHDLHPVVRGVAAGDMPTNDKERLGQRVLDYFSSLPHAPYDEAESLDDLHATLHVVRTLIRLGRNQRAADAFRSNALHRVLYQKLDAPNEILTLLRPLLAGNWTCAASGIELDDTSFLAHTAGNALDAVGLDSYAVEAYASAVRSNLKLEDWTNASVSLNGVAASSKGSATRERALRLSVAIAELTTDASAIFASRVFLVRHLAMTAQWQEADALWAGLDAMKGGTHVFSPEYVKLVREQSLFLSSERNWERLQQVGESIRSRKETRTIRQFEATSGIWRIEAGFWNEAVQHLAEAVRMARENGVTDSRSETGLALAKHRLGQLPEPQREAERLSQLRDPSNRYLAELWLALGDQQRAKHHAKEAYRSAWDDGEPYVYRYELTKSTELLTRLGVEIPRLPPYDPTKSSPFPCEDEIRAAIEKLRAEKARKESGAGLAGRSKN